MRTYEDILDYPENRKTFLIELQSRPDGVVNQSVTSYSTSAITMSMYHQRCAAAYSNTTFLCVTLMIIDEIGSMLASTNIKTQYVPPEPEPEPDPEPDGGV